MKSRREEKAKYNGYFPYWHIVVELDNEEMNAKADEVHEALTRDFDTQS
jgi:hypothetical protein